MTIRWAGAPFRLLETPPGRIGDARPGKVSRIFDARRRRPSGPKARRGSPSSEVAVRCPELLPFPRAHAVRGAEPPGEVAGIGEPVVAGDGGNGAALRGGPGQGAAGPPPPPPDSRTAG